MYCYRIRKNYKMSRSSPLLDKFTPYIFLVYNKLSDLFPLLGYNHICDIEKCILDGTYKFSPLEVRDYSQRDKYAPDVYHTIHVKDISNNLSIHKVYFFNSKDEDRLVQTALGIFLNKYIVSVLMSNSYGHKIQIDDYYKIVCSRENVIKLYRFDLMNYCRSVNRESVLSKLSHIVKDEEILKYVKEYLSLPLLTEGGVDISDQFGIAPSGFLSSSLLNLALSDFDKDFQLLFPHLDYIRYIDEVLVSCNSGMSFQKFEEEVVSLFDKYNIIGKIMSIGPGEGPMECGRCKFIVSKEGNISVYIKK